MSINPAFLLLVRKIKAFQKALREIRREIDSIKQKITEKQKEKKVRLERQKQDLADFDRKQAEERERFLRVQILVISRIDQQVEQLEIQTERVKKLPWRRQERRQILVYARICSPWGRGIKGTLRKAIEVAGKDEQAD